MSADVDILTTYVPHAIVLPNDAVTTVNGRSNVFVVDKGVAHKRVVGSEKPPTRKRWISLGLRPGDTVVATKVPGLTDGARVRDTSGCFRCAGRRVTAFFSYLEEAVTALWRNRARSGLTMLGMIIGSASIITVFGVSRAASGGIASTFASFGQLPVSVFAEHRKTIHNWRRIHYRDVKTVAARSETRRPYVEPSWQRTYRVASTAKHDYETVVSDGGYHNDSLAMLSGRRFVQQDVDSAARICVLTNDLALKYFGSAPAAIGSVLPRRRSALRGVGRVRRYQRVVFKQLVGQQRHLRTVHDVLGRSVAGRGQLAVGLCSTAKSCGRRRRFSRKSVATHSRLRVRSIPFRTVPASSRVSTAC